MFGVCIVYLSYVFPYLNSSVPDCDINTVSCFCQSHDISMHDYLILSVLSGKIS